MSLNSCTRGYLKALLPALFGLLAASRFPAAELTVERLFAAPDLSGDSLRAPRLSPDGRLVAYLKAAADNRDRLDLWAYDIRRGEHRRLIDARALQPVEKPLSAEEAARRERQRSSALSGILEYGFSPDSRKILVPLAGDLYVYDLAAPAATAVRALTATESYETDARFSPQGRYVSFIRDQNLVVIDLTTGTETAITTAGRDTVSYGMAEFIAQEEMNRDTGYWWSPDDSRLAYTRVDESGVAETQRFEIDARTVRVVQQRYPFTGATNAEVVAVRHGDRDSRAARCRRSGPVEGHLSRACGFLPGRPASRRAAAEPRPEDTRSAEDRCSHRHRHDAADRTQHHLGAAQRRPHLSREAPPVRLGLEPQRIPAPVSLRREGPSDPCAYAGRPVDGR